jgi:hypothetical protein
MTSWSLYHLLAGPTTKYSCIEFQHVSFEDILSVTIGENVER